MFWGDKQERNCRFCLAFLAIGIPFCVWQQYELWTNWAKPEAPKIPAHLRLDLIAQSASFTGCDDLVIRTPFLMDEDFERLGTSTLATTHNPKYYLVLMTTKKQWERVGPMLPFETCGYEICGWRREKKGRAN